MPVLEEACCLRDDKDSDLWIDSEMAWTQPEHTHGRVDKAGDMLIALSSLEDEMDGVLDIVNNWRSSHGRPLQIIKMTLKKRAQKVDPAAIVAQRIKRIPAITLKLRNNATMRLSKMHDIGGCRGVLKSVSDVEELVKVYQEATAKNPRRGGEFVKEYDYINKPKPDGYRGVHLVYKYHSESADLDIYNGLRVEIQIRSQHQHAWATAVETVDAFTGQALKSNIGKDAWKRFFALMACAIAMNENRPLVPGTPNTMDELRDELASFSEQIHLLEGMAKATEVGAKNEQGEIFLLESNSRERKIQITVFTQASLPFAETQYLAVEKQIKENPDRQAVLVSADSLSALRKAYPNYFLDIKEFLKMVRAVTRPRWIV